MHKKICSVAGCTSSIKAWGMCSRHYQQWRSDENRTITKVETKVDDLTNRYRNSVDTLYAVCLKLNGMTEQDGLSEFKLEYVKKTLENTGIIK